MPKPADPIIDAALCRAARGFLNWSQDQLAVAASLSRPTIYNFEAGAIIPWPVTRRAIEAAFASSGIRFERAEGTDAVDMMIETNQHLVVVIIKIRLNAGIEIVP